MDLRTLESTTLESRHDAFRRAFADYSVTLDLTPAQLGEMHRRRGVRLDLSVGAFEDGEIAGFTFNGFGEWNGLRSGYDAGTGVVPDARRRGLASLMMERSLELLRDAGASCYVLEVLQTNAAAFSVYDQMGFRVSRDFVCLSLDRVASPSSAGIIIETTRSLDDVAREEMWDWQPSWQNSSESIGRAAESRKTFVAREGTCVTGYAVLFDSGDLSQFAVARAHRRRGIGRALLQAARDASDRPLRIVNVDARDAGTLRFLDAVGASEFVRQHEMTLAL